MLALLNWRVWAALALAGALAFSHLVVYRSGKANIRASWDAAKVIQQQALADAEKAARAKEQSLQLNVTEAVNAARKRETTLKADAARARDERDSLRVDADNFARVLPSLTADAVSRYAAAANDVLGQCSRRYQGVAEAADGFASDALTLQQAWPR